MKLTERLARPWLSVLAVSVLTGVGYGQTTGTTARTSGTSVDVTASPAEPAARLPLPSRSLPRLDPALTPANHQTGGGYASPQSNYQTTPQAMPASPSPGIPQGYNTQSTVPQYPPGIGQGYAPPPNNNYFVNPGTGYGYGPPPGAGYGYGPPPTMGVWVPIPMNYGPAPGAGFGYGPPPGAGFGYGPPPGAGFGFGPPPGTGFGSGPPPGVPFGSGPVFPAGVGFANGPGLNAITNQTVSVPTTRATNRVRVRGPGMLGSGLARLGERLTQFGRTRIETTQETDLYTPLSQPSGGVATISSMGTTPLIPQQNSVSLPPGQGQGYPGPQQQPPCPPQGQCPSPSPQAMPSPQKGQW